MKTSILEVAKSSSPRGPR